MLFYASTSITDGSWDERFVDGTTVVKNRADWCNKHKLTLSRLVFAQQNHGARIAVITEDNRGSSYQGSTKVGLGEGIDGLISNAPETFLTMMTADCIPVFFHSAVPAVVGIAHCGWKGLLAELPIHMIQMFQERFHAKAEDICVAIGPSIRRCCYRVDRSPDGRVAIFQARFGREVAQNGYLDLQLILAKQLLQIGITENHMKLDAPCTACDKNYFSYYRDGKMLKGQQAHIIGMR
jgi:polyphenol oxidase